MVFTNVTNPRSEVDRKEEFKRTLVKRGATIGANTTILCGVTLGSYCFVGTERCGFSPSSIITAHRRYV
jgi:UDP-2-acetamido-3-amino-2,3-dideoxy-glucuronate N-acetyltransferase